MSTFWWILNEMRQNLEVRQNEDKLNSPFYWRGIIPKYCWRKTVKEFRIGLGWVWNNEVVV